VGDLPGNRFWARQIVEEAGVAEEIDVARVSAARTDDVYEGLKWTLARDPAVGVRIPSGDGAFMLYKTSSSWTAEGLPVVRVAYTYDEDQVVFLAVKVDH